MLLEYFSLCSRDDFCRNLLYIDIPVYYVWKKVNNHNTWVRRQRGENIIGRIFSVSPTYVELFHLRLLLLNVKGITSFNCLKTYDGQIFTTFKAACLARGLIEDDEEWRKAMQEGANWMMPRQLRRLFVRLLIHCSPAEPEKLWSEFKGALSEDYSRTFPTEVAIRKAYMDIINLISLEGRSISDFPSMEQLNDELTENGSDDVIAADDHYKFGKRLYDTMNDDQKMIVDTILEAITSENPICAYIDGVGGSGKTYVYRTLYHLLKSKGKKVISIAFTGIAAILLPHGKTLHKTFGLPVPLLNDSSSKIKIQSPEAKILIENDVLFLDEAPMSPRYALEIMDRTLKDFMNNNLPFGGKNVIMGGDFRQLLPVQARATRCEIVDLSIKYSYTWAYFRRFQLTQNVRVVPEEVEFTELLLKIGNGSLNDSNCNVALPEELIAHPQADIVQDVYGQLIRQKNFDELAECAILAARNADVDELNQKVVDLLDETTERIYTSIDSVDVGEDNGRMAETLLPEYLNSLNPPSLPPHELRLRKNCIVMLIRNISIDEGLCNGTRLQVLDFSNHLLKCKILTGDKVGETVFLSRITLSSENDYPFTFKRRQFPIKLAFASTINKSQGQTFKKIGIYLLRDVFSHGQLYVAMSRVRSKSGLKIYGTDGRNVVKNYVYPEILNEGAGNS